MNLTQVECCNKCVVHVPSLLVRNFDVNFIKCHISDTELLAALDLYYAHNLQLKDDRVLIQSLWTCAELDLEIPQQTMQFASHRLAKGSKHCSVISCGYGDLFFGEVLFCMPRGNGTIMHADGSLKTTNRNPMHYTRIDSKLVAAFSHSELDDLEIGITIATGGTCPAVVEGCLELLYCSVVRKQIESLLDRWEASKESHVKKTLLRYLTREPIILLDDHEPRQVKNVRDYCMALFVESGYDISMDRIVGTGHKWQIDFLKKLRDDEILGFLQTAIALELLGVCALSRAIFDTFAKCSTKTDDGWRTVANTHGISDISQWKALMSRGIMRKMHEQKEKECEAEADQAMQIILDYEKDIELKKQQKAAKKLRRKKDKGKKKRKLATTAAVGQDRDAQSTNKKPPTKELPATKHTDPHNLAPDLSGNHSANAAQIDSFSQAETNSLKEWFDYMRKDGIWQPKDSDFSSTATDVARMMRLVFGNTTPQPKNMGPLIEFMTKLGLYPSPTWRIFMREEIDMEALRLLTNDDYISMGVRVGPRKKILSALSAIGSE